MKRETPDNAEFLPEFLSRPWSLDTKYGVRPIALFIGQGSNALEVAVVQATRILNRSALVEMWKARKARRLSISGGAANLRETERRLYPRKQR